MNSSSILARKLNTKTELDENHAIRIHRSISWLKSAEQHEKATDIKFISLWIAFNACYANTYNQMMNSTEKEMFRSFLDKLVKLDDESRFFNILWNKFSGPVRILLENKYIYKPFWDYQRGVQINWESLLERQNKEANQYLSREEVVPLMMMVLDRLYTLRNTIIHGGSTFQSSINRKQLRDGCNILSTLLPVIIEVMLEHPEGWGSILYPVIKE
jgi:hypothetical protein